jgi:hypothetical protein
MQDLFKTIEQRNSTRNFAKIPLNLATKSQLLDFITHQCHNLTNEPIKLQLIETDPQKPMTMKIDYGMVKNHHTYIVGKVEKSVHSRTNYGYVMEQVVLKATELDLATCWIGYFDPSFFADIELNDKEQIPSIVIVGYPNTNFSIAGKLMQMAVRSTKRKHWHDLFYYGQNLVALDRNHTGKYCDALEMLRLAPSSGNTQPWRVVVDGRYDRVHFYKNPISDRYNRMGFHDVDMGIAMSHFFLTLKQQEIYGRWANIITHIDIPDDWQYVMSWVGEE